MPCKRARSEDIESGEQDPSKSVSDSTSTSTTVPLEAFGVLRNCGHDDRPADLQDLVDLLLTPPNPTAQNSPRAESILKRACRQARNNASTGREALREQMWGSTLSDGETKDLISRGIDYISDDKLERAFLPSVMKTWPYPTIPVLEQPIPDSIYGYVRFGAANDNEVPPIFSLEDEILFSPVQVSSQVNFPFFSAQWKSVSGSMDKAANRGAQDGAAICNAMYWFLRGTGHQNPGAANTAHFSATCDATQARFWVHWLDETELGTRVYHMDSILTCSLSKKRDTEELRAFMKALSKHAMSTRLEVIKENLPRYKRQDGTPAEELENADGEDGEGIKRTVASAAGDDKDEGDASGIDRILMWRDQINSVPPEGMQYET